MNDRPRAQLSANTTATLRELLDVLIGDAPSGSPSVQNISALAENLKASFEQDLHDVGDLLDVRDGPDLPSHLTVRELELVCEHARQLTSSPDASVSVLVRDLGPDSPLPATWVELTVAGRRLVLHRQTFKLYELDEDGAVADDPLPSPS